MPIAAVAGIVAGASALATGVGVMGTISAIGGIVGGIGVLTKSKELTALGAIAGLAGGVGAFAQGQGWLSSGSAMDTASSAASESGISRMLAAPSGAEAIVPDATNASSAAAVNGADLASDQAGGLFNADAASSATAGLTQTSPTANLTQTTSELATQNAPTSGLTDPTNPMSAFNAARDSQAANIDLGAVAIDGYRGMPGSNPGTASIFGTLKSFGDWMEKNKTLASIGANFIGGAFDKTKQAQADLLRARADTERAQLANASAVPNMNFTTRQPAGGMFPQTAPTYQPVRTGGLFNAR